MDLAEDAMIITKRELTATYSSISNNAPDEGTVRTTYSSIYFDREHSFPSERSIVRKKYNIGLSVLLVIITTVLVAFGAVEYHRAQIPKKKARAIQKAIAEHAAAAAIRAQQCRGFDWQTACDKLGDAGARRRHRNLMEEGGGDDDGGEGELSEEDSRLFDKDDFTVTFDNNCIRVYRLKMFGEITFPYHSSQRLLAGGNHTMALFIQHGALRNAEEYFCSFKKLMKQQNYRNFQDILIIAPDFNYENDALVHPNDAFWNASKPWGDWRVGAESDPACCGNTGRTVSSFDVLDHMLTLLTDKKLFPRMNKISYVGHSAGGQMVQRYAVLSILAALWDFEESVDVKFIVANPSSYAYLGPERFQYSCGNCKCNVNNCSCDAACGNPSDKLAIPQHSGAGSKFPCYVWNYDRWPYGIGALSDMKGDSIPYSMRDGIVSTARAKRLYRRLHVVYMVGQNDTCNDMLSTCDASCWKREDFLPNEWKCFRNDMDTRCPAMLQGPNRRTRGYQYMKYLEWLYGEPTHVLHTIPGCGHNATGMFSSDIGMQELFA